MGESDERGFHGYINLRHHRFGFLHYKITCPQIRENQPLTGKVVRSGSIDFFRSISTRNRDLKKPANRFAADYETIYSGSSCRKREREREREKSGGNGNLPRMDGWLAVKWKIRLLSSHPRGGIINSRLGPSVACPIFFTFFIPATILLQPPPRGSSFFFFLFPFLLSFFLSLFFFNRESC